MTADERALSHSLSATIAGPVGIAVADARVDEAAGALLAFAVTLSRAASGTVTVDFATADGSAQAGVDYTAARDTLTFQAGESPQTVNVTVLDDLHDEGEETLTLSLSNASGGRLTDDEATGTIVNTDPLPRALLARFGRAAACTWSSTSRTGGPRSRCGRRTGTSRTSTSSICERRGRKMHNPAPLGSSIATNPSREIMSDWYGRGCRIWTGTLPRKSQSERTGGNP